MKKEIDYNKLSEFYPDIEVEIGDVNKKFRVEKENPLGHGHGMPGEYDFTKDEKSLVKWLAESFKIEDYMQIVDSFFKENGLDSSDLRGFILGISDFKLCPIQAEKIPEHPDMILTGKYRGIDYTLCFRNHKLTNIVNRHRKTYNGNNLVEEDYDMYGMIDYRTEFKNDDKEGISESCIYDRNGVLIRKIINNYKDLLTEEYSYSDGSVLHSIARYNVDGSEKEVCIYNTDKILIIRKTFDENGHTDYTYNEKTGKLEKIQKFDKKGNRISLRFIHHDL